MNSRRRFLFFTASGAPVTGLTPTAGSWLTVAGDAPSVSAPSIAEVGGGVYTYEVPADLDEDVVLVVDGGVGAADNRYQMEQIRLADFNLGPRVVWSPFQQVRQHVNGEEEGSLFLYVYLEDREGRPITGLNGDSLDSVSARRLQEQSSTSPTVPVTVDTNFLAEVGAEFPGLYSFTLSSSDFGGWDVIFLSFVLTADTQTQYIVPVYAGLADAGGGGPDGILGVILMIVFMVTGTNAVFRWTTYDSDGRPLAGFMDLYQDATGAAAQDPLKLIASMNTAYTYDAQGRQVLQHRTLDAENLAAIFTYLHSIGGGDE